MALGWERTGKGGAMLGVAFFRLLCSRNERARLPKDTSTSAAQLLPSSQPAFFLQGETFASFTASCFKRGCGPWGWRAFGLGGCGSTELRDTLIKNNNNSRDMGLILHSPTNQAGIYCI